MIGQFNAYMPASVLAWKFEAIFWYITAVTGGVGLILYFVLLWLCVKYRRGNTTGSTPRILGSHRLELIWTITPLFVFLSFYAWGAIVYDYAVTPPEDAQEIHVFGKQWMWKAQYPGGQRVIIGGNPRNMSEEDRARIGSLVVPVDKPFKLTMISEDVIHSFGIPAFRIKIDVLPGRYTSQWHHPTRLGEYHIFCDQYCGTWHSLMVGKVKVVSQAEYEQWLRDRVDGSLAWDGQQLFRKLQCIDCHVPNAGAGTRVHPKAPSLEGLYGATVPLEGGGTAVADDAYIRESIRNPRAKVVQGWKPIMPAYDHTQATEEDLRKVIAYIRSLKPGDVIPPNERFPAPNGAPRVSPDQQPSTGSTGEKK
jgi:cytochrome c oxidase subunit 2